MKIEVNYLSNKWGKMLGTKVEVTLNECYSDALVPVYRIVRDNRKETIYRYNGNFWTEYPFMTWKKFIYELHYGLFYDLPMDKPVDDEWMANWLKAGEQLFWKVEEPFYYLDPFFSSPSDMVKASYENKGVICIRRHFAPHQRKLALNYAELICNMVMRSDVTRKAATPEAIIEVLNPDGTAKTLLEKRQFQCNHCGTVVFADEAILLDHLSDYHPDLLDEAGYPDEATAEDVIYPNFTEVFWEEDIQCEDDTELSDVPQKQVQCKHCLGLLPADEAAMREHIKNNHPNVHEDMQFPFVTTDAFISLNFYEVEPKAPAEKYCCKHCGAIFEYDEENLWGHLQFEHPDVFAEDQNLETPDMIEAHWVKE